MKFNIETVLSDMLAAMKSTVSKDWKKLKPYAEQFLQNKKSRLVLIADLRITGELNQEDFESRLEDEKLILEAELNALAVISKAIVQNAVNSAMNILENAVKIAISAAI